MGYVSPKLLRLSVPARLALQVTPAQFAALAAANHDLRLERTATGELMVNPPTGSETGYRNWSLSGELYLWWRNAGEPGKAFDSSSGFELPNGATRSPDASWVSPDRWDALTPEQRQGFAPLCPDFVVENCGDIVKSGVWLGSRRRPALESYRGCHPSGIHP
ncbi:Uma2 family endonuclease [Phormidium sp. FACHB-1136]|uniref:Uma2 family endonuclease n=1 Tax=Phormidium sp. FACHB-1136 TaxID=2692848 RepID=UPI00168557F9|nr:Uma2 family endonuclease [Phormidium sp. FACHB-1136]MBD2427165.1 Uma2 family endonuclease [Phormidium sp. FACHB-1136]